MIVCRSQTSTHLEPIFFIYLLQFFFYYIFDCLHSLRQNFIKKFEEPLALVEKKIVPNWEHWYLKLVVVYIQNNIIDF